MSAKKRINDAVWYVLAILAVVLGGYGLIIYAVLTQWSR
jgi:cytoskeletal protein RodZ